LACQCRMSHKYSYATWPEVDPIFRPIEAKKQAMVGGIFWIVVGAAAGCNPFFGENFRFFCSEAFLWDFLRRFLVRGTSSFVALVSWVSLSRRLRRYGSGGRPIPTKDPQSKRKHLWGFGGNHAALALARIPHESAQSSALTA